MIKYNSIKYYNRKDSVKAIKYRGKSWQSPVWAEGHYRKIIQSWGQWQWWWGVIRSILF
jgi:hypothetical protein